MKKWHYLCAALAALIFSGNALADGAGVTAKVGTLGAGLELTKGFSPKLNGRLGFNTFSFDDSGTESGITYDIDLDLATVTALLDWHPTGGSFRASAGIVGNGNELNMRARSASSYTIGDTSYTPAQIGTLSGKVTFDDVVPYLGIGWGNAVEDGQKVTFSFDLGVIFQGTPDVDLTTTSSVAGLADDLLAEERQLQQELDDFDAYPVISFGAAWNF